MTTQTDRPTATTAVVVAALTGAQGLLLAASAAADVPLATRERMAVLAGRIGTEIELIAHTPRQHPPAMGEARIARGGVA